MRRLLLVVLSVLAVGVLGVGGASRATADDIPLPVMPSGVPGPEEVLGGDTGGLQVPAGPTYEVTPGSAGTSLGKPVDHAAAPDRSAVDDARKALGRVRRAQGSGTASGTAAGSKVAAPQAVEPVAATSPADDRRTWLVGSAALLALVLVETRRAVRRRPPG